jgi:hypothetical protein
VDEADPIHLAASFAEHDLKYYNLNREEVCFVLFCLTLMFFLLQVSWMLSYFSCDCLFSNRSTLLVAITPIGGLSLSTSISGNLECLAHWS